MRSLVLLIALIGLPFCAFAGSFTQYQAPNGKYISVKVSGERAFTDTGAPLPNGKYYRHGDGKEITVQKGIITHSRAPSFHWFKKKEGSNQASRANNRSGSKHAASASRRAGPHA